MKEKYYKLNNKELYKMFDSKDSGLSSIDAKERLDKYGRNKLKVKKKKSKLIKFLEQFKNLMVIILLITSIISFLVAYFENESFIEGFVILGIVILNAILGYVQEAKADKAIEELKKMSVPDVKVKRDKKIKIINIEEVVVGDILVLEAGDYVPADARIISSISLKVEEASLTGESGSVEKDINVLENDEVINEITNMIFFGSNIVYGKCEALVVATGMDTELGTIAKTLSEESETDTPLQIKIKNISKVLTVIVGIIVVLMILIGLINGEELLDVFIIAISLAVAAIPEGLPAIITIILSLGMTRLAKNKAVVRKIASVETLGCTEVVCSDKTGTITKNQMVVRKFYFNEEITTKINNDLVNKVLVLCNDVVKQDTYIGDPTEIALYQYVEKNANIKDYLKYKRVYEFPFDSNRKLMTTIYDIDGEYYAFVKGSTEFILDRCKKYHKFESELKISKKDIDNIKKNEKELSNEALRVLGLAYKKVKKQDSYLIEEIEKDLTFIALTGMIDPPREDVKESIKICNKAGLRPIMITGDSLDTAIAIAKEVGIYNEKYKVIEGKVLDSITDEELVKTVHHYSVYARVTPEHKLRIVKAWQANKKVVAMTGDGVNDAPAIKASDVGVGMGITGTEVSKNVSDIVLLDDSFSTIILAVEEGRNIYENIRKSITYLLTANIAEIIIVFVSMLFGANIFLPLHLLYINLVTDSLPAIALSFEKNDKDIMKKPSRKNTGSLFTPFITAKIFSSSILKAITVLILYFSSVYLFGEIKATTVAFLALILLEMAFALSSRNLFKSVFGETFFDNKIMNMSMLFLIGLQFLVFTYRPISDLFEIIELERTEVLFILGFVLVAFGINEAIKPVIAKIFKD